MSLVEAPAGAECSKIAHRRSLANSAARTISTHFIRRRNRGSLAIFFAEEIAYLGASTNRAMFWGAVKIAAAGAENLAILVHSALVPQHSDNHVSLIFRFVLPPMAYLPPLTAP